MTDLNYGISSLGTDSYWTTTAGLLVALFTILFAYFYQRKPRAFPPGPRALPIVGVYPFLGKFRHVTFRNWGKKYGPVLGVPLFAGSNIVVLNDYESINEALVKNKEVFSGRIQHPFFSKIFRGVVRRTYDDGWTAMRRFGLNTLRGYGMGKKSMETRVQEELGYLNEEIQQHDGKALNIHGMLANAISNNICSMIFGQRFNYDDEVFKGIMDAFINMFFDPKLTHTVRCVTFAPFLKNLPPFSKNLKMFVASQEKVLDFVRTIINDHKRTFNEDNLRDVIDAFVKEMNQGKKHFDDIMLVNFIRDLFFAGTETTTSTLRWGILCLIYFPEEQKKLHKEILNVLGNDGVVSMAHREEMQYTQAFIEELYRFKTLAPLSVDHCTTQDVQLRGHFIPKNTMVYPNIWAVHNDPELFPQPDLFKPERHLDSQSRFVKSRHVIPFSVGPRHCLGEQLARMEVFMFLVNLVQKFEFLPDPDARELPDFENGGGVQGFLPLQFKCVAKVR